MSPSGRVGLAVAEEIERTASRGRLASGFLLALGFRVRIGFGAVTVYGAPAATRRRTVTDTCIPAHLRRHRLLTMARDSLRRRAIWQSGGGGAGSEAPAPSSSLEVLTDGTNAGGTRAHSKTAPTTDCCTTVTYVLLALCFVTGILVAATGRESPPSTPRGTPTPNTPWDPSSGAKEGNNAGAGTGAGGSRSGSGSGGSRHDPADGEDNTRGGARSDWPQYGLLESLGIIAVDRLAHVKDYLEGMVGLLQIMLATSRNAMLTIVSCLTWHPMSWKKLSISP